MANRCLNTRACGSCETWRQREVREIETAPGGPDGMGGCWPCDGNTGVPAGTVLSAYTGPCTIAAAGTVIDKKTVNCSLDIRAHDIVFINNIFKRGPYQGQGYSSCGVWGSISDFGSSRPGNQWINNRWDDGNAVPPAD